MNTHPPCQPTRSSGGRRRLIQATAIIDAAGTLAAPGAIVLEADRIVAAGSPQAVGQVEGAFVERLEGQVVIPALVNAHAHLDLTHIGPLPLAGGFADWANQVREARARSEDDIADSVLKGVRLSRAGGTALIGDIAGVRSPIPLRTLRASGLAGVSFLEVFGIGRTQSDSIDFLRAAAAMTGAIESGVRFGIQPHAPYSCGPEVYRAAASLGLPLATHLAETFDELEFVARGSGALADMLKRIGVWDESITGFGVHPIEHVAGLVAGGGRRVLAAHVNYLDDAHIDTLVRGNIVVAYCPRASAYFGHVNHRYQHLITAGVHVALGTDSILCLDTTDRISVLDEMRMLHRRDAADPMSLLRMATITGAMALGARESLVTLKSGESAGLLVLPARGRATSATGLLAQALESDDPPRWLLGPIAGRNEWLQ